ncbi:Uncharacterized protein OBRU01_19299, partial [Operophtera brumata]
MDGRQPLSEVIQSLHDRMTQFEGALLISATPTTVEAIAADYAAFKSFTLGVLKTLQRQVEILAGDADQLEMRSRRKILLFHGVPEVSKEDTASLVVKTVTANLKLPDFTGAQISRCHRMGRAGNGDRPRPILVKVRDVVMRDSVWFAKTNLKGSNVTLSEFLTRPRHLAFMSARERFGVKNCWTKDGHIHIVGPDGARHRICSLSELNELLPPEGHKPTAPAALQKIKPPEHLGEVVHGLPLALRQRVELVQHEVGDGLGDGGPLERRLAQRALDAR